MRRSIRLFISFSSERSNQREYVKQQMDMGVDAVISDNILRIYFFSIRFMSFFFFFSYCLGFEIFGRRSNNGEVRRYALFS